MRHALSETGDRIPWQTGHLWARLKARSAHGLRTGALESIETTAEYLESVGMRFVVRILANLSRKEKARKQQGKTIPANPFLPYEEDLYVTDISETHLCLLNKFNVVDHHFLIVTREYESQENWLTLADFEALVRCLSEVEGLAFFNGGTVAGSSQPHKHLQVVPNVREQVDFSMAAAIAAVEYEQARHEQSEDEQAVGRSSLLPFRHTITKFAYSDSLASLVQPADQQTAEGSNAAQRYLTSYHQLLSAVGISSNNNWQGTQTAAYNLLCTRQWMMVVPRSQEKYLDISVNSLGFAGSLLVKNEKTLTRLKAVGPLNLLQAVGYRR